MFEEENGTFTSGFTSANVFAVKYPTQTTITEIRYNRLDDTRDGAAYSSASISAD